MICSDAYMRRLDKVSSPSIAGKSWVVLQEDPEGPLFLCLRPSEAKVNMDLLGSGL